MNISNYTKIALFFITLGVGGGAYIITASNGLSDFSTREYETVISDATGLSTRSKIYQAGVVVGRVKGITLSENEAVLRLALMKDVQVREGAMISRKSSSILGTSILALDPGSGFSPVISPGGRLKSSKDAGDMSQVMGTIGDLGGQISQLLTDFQQNQLALLSVSLETFNSIASKVNEQADGELERVSRILEAVALITERMERILARGEDQGTGPAADIYGTLENIRIITDEISRGRGNIGQTIFDDQLYDSLLSTVQRIEVAVVKLQTALDTINTVAESAGTVIDNAGIIVEKAVGLGVQVDATGSYMTQANQVQAGASIRLIPQSNDRWYRIGVSSAPDGYSTRTVTETTGTNTIREDTTETKYQVVTIDAELARRFGLLTIRGGLLENTGGFGMDIQPLRWMSLSGELFNFRTGEPPNLRGTVTVFPFFDPDSDKPWNWIYIKGGINDSLADSRDFFIGGGIRFADREIKGLVGLVPALNN
ncbi:MAG: MlaD family protein [Treponema sp.]|jgi:phospholipid/cholesterol/gamma-HCH transport system substrate-binding protein|nr:MlaD family protein [Treponema sp.]